MFRLSIVLTVLIWNIIPSNGVEISFVSWNVNDNKKIEAFNIELISTLLNLKSTKELPDVYAITFQENCIDCRSSNLHRIAQPFKEALQKIKSIHYELVSIYDTRESDYCESMYCLSYGNMHGTTFMMVLVKSSWKISDSFKEKNSDCSAGLISNTEKGIAVIGFTMSNKKLCFGGLHLDVNSESSRKQCFVDLLEKVEKRCDVLFFGGDFNVRPKSKFEKVPNEFEGGQNKLFLEKMRETDEFSGSKPYSGQVNFLEYVRLKRKMLFIEPFNKAPQFLPTYSIKSSLKCKDFPICYELKRFPAWTDRIIYYPESMVKCSAYSIVPDLAIMSDHIPIYANCEVIM